MDSSNVRNKKEALDLIFIYAKTNKDLRDLVNAGVWLKIERRNSRYVLMSGHDALSEDLKIAVTDGSTLTDLCKNCLNYVNAPK